MAIDIGAIVKAPMADKDWVKKCAIMGLFCLIPIAGLFNLLGWMKACVKARQNGDTNLPESGFSYLGEGWGVFLSMLPVVGVIIVVEIAITIVVMILSKISPGLGSIVGMLSMLVVSLLALGIGIAQPAMLYRHIIHGDKFGSLKFAEIMALIKGNFSPYLMLWVVNIVAGIIGQLGGIACGVGLLVTLPMAMAMQGFALADFAKEVNNA